MAKFNEETIQKCVDWVCENGLIDYGGAKLIDFCNVMGIGKSTYYRWMENETFGNAIKKAERRFQKRVRTQCRFFPCKVCHRV